MSAAARPTLLLTAVVLLLGGCGEPDTGPSANELVRRRQVAEMAKLSQSKTPEQRLEAARAFLAEGNLVAAQRQIRPLLISQPEDPQLILLSARIEAAAGDKIAASEALEAIGPSQPESHREALWLAAQWLIERGHYEAAQAKLQRMLKQYEDTERVRRRLAMLLNNQGRRIEAAEHLRALARSGGIREKELFAMNTYSEPFIDESVPKPDFGGELTPAALAQAKRLHADGELVKARDLVERLRRRFPDSARIAAFQGRVYSDVRGDQWLGDWAADLPEGVQREPEYWHVLGKWLQRQGQYREAVRCFAETIARDPTDRTAYLGLARSLERLGKHEAAVRANQRFELLSEAAGIARKIGLEPGSFAQLSRMAEILDQLGRPWEAISWREVAWKSRGIAAAEGERPDWEAQRQALARREGEQRPDAAHLCGLDLANWPLPSGEVLGVEPASRTAPAAGAVANADPLVFQDVAGEAELDFQYDNGSGQESPRFLHQVNGGGIAVIDLDLDGYSDVYLTQGGGDAFDPHGCQPNRLFRNLQAARFADVTDSAQTGDRGYGQGAAVADLNQDGFPDLVVANIGPNRCYLNNGDGTFSSRPIAPPTVDPGWTTTIACGDLSGDHLPEIVEVNYVNDPSALTTACTAGNRDRCNPSVFRPAVDRVWRLDARGDFAAWDGCQEMAEQPNYGFAAVIANLDEKAGNDVFIANDTKENHCWISQSADRGDRDPSSEHSLVEIAQIYGCAIGLLGQRQGSMGIAHGDFDRNGLLDLHVTNYWNQPADLYMQQSSRFFVNENAKNSFYSETQATVGWGTQAVDFDRNGWLDLAVLNGHVTDHRNIGQPLAMRPQLFRGDAKGFASADPHSIVGDYWSRPALGRTMAVLDWNCDGKPDLLTNHLDLPVALLENRSEGGNSLRLELVGTLSERDATGAVVTVRCGEESWTGAVVGGDGFLCSNEAVLDFGIGAADEVDSVEVRWPSGATQQFSDLAANRRYLMVEEDQTAFLRE